MIKKEIENMKQTNDSKLIIKEHEDKINALKEVIENHSKEMQ